MSVVTKRRVRTSGGELAVIDVGEGPALVLLHGFPLSSFLWRRFIPLLAERFRVIAPDLLGAGESDRPEEARLDIRAQAGYVREALQGLGVESYAVVAHGEGGGVAQRLMLEGADVAALVLIASIAFSEWPVGVLPGDGVDARTVVQRVLAGGTGPGRSLPPEVIETYARAYEGPAGLAAYTRAARALDGLGLSGREAELAAWDLPILILWGEDDPYHPVRLAERLNEAIPASTLALLPGCGHYLPEEAPETIGPLVAEYLRARYLRAPHSHGQDKAGVVMLQLERRPAWLDLEEDERDDWFDVGDPEDAAP